MFLYYALAFGAWLCFGTIAVLIQGKLDAMDETPVGMRLRDDWFSFSFFFAFGWVMVLAWIAQLIFYAIHLCLPVRRYTLKEWFSLRCV